jgi:hypothetical protein
MQINAVSRYGSSTLTAGETVFNPLAYFDVCWTSSLVRMTLTCKMSVKLHRMKVFIYIYSSLTEQQMTHAYTEIS